MLLYYRELLANFIAFLDQVCYCDFLVLWLIQGFIPYPVAISKHNIVPIQSQTQMHPSVLSNTVVRFRSNSGAKPQSIFAVMSFVPMRLRVGFRSDYSILYWPRSCSVLLSTLPWHTDFPFLLSSHSITSNSKRPACVKFVLFVLRKRSSVFVHLISCQSWKQRIGRSKQAKLLQPIILHSEPHTD